MERAPTVTEQAMVLAAGALLVAAVMWARQWRAQPTAVGAPGIPAKARATAGKVILGRSDRDTIGLATAAGIVVAQWLADRLIEATAWLAGITGLDAAAWAPAGADAVVLAVVAVAVFDVVVIGLCQETPGRVAVALRRMGVGVLHPALRHSIAGLLLPAVLVAGTPLLAQTTSDAVAAVGNVPEPAACAPANLQADTIAGYGPQQLANAAVIVQVGQEMGVPERGQRIALATAMQESALRNLDVGDRDSLGLFQQRPSQGWGTPAQVRDPRYAAGKFYAALLRVRNWVELPMWQAAQAVQRSAYPTAYDKYADAAALVLGAVRGLTCPAEIRS